MPAHDVRHLTTDTPRVMVVDGSKLVRRLIGDMLQRDLPGVEVIGCAGLSEAKAALEAGPVDLVTTSLVLMDGDGLQVARHVRTTAAQRYVPVIVVSGDAQAHLEARRFTEDVTDYFDKAEGYAALAAFIRGYVQPQPIPDARVLYVEARASSPRLMWITLMTCACSMRRVATATVMSAASTCCARCATISATASAACRCW